MTPILLQSSKIAVEYNGHWVHLDAVTEITGDTSITLLGPERKTIFGYSPPLLQGRAHNSISINLLTYITKGFPEYIFFEMFGFKPYLNRTYQLEYPEIIGSIAPSCTIYIYDELSDTAFAFYNAVVTGIDMPFLLDRVGQINIQLTASRMLPTDMYLPDLTVKQGLHVLPLAVNIQMSSYNSSPVGLSLTMQRQLITLDPKNYYNTDSVVSDTTYITSGSEVGASIQEYMTNDRILYLPLFETGLEIKQSGIRIRIQNGIVTKRESLGNTPSVYWDYKALDLIEIEGPTSQEPQ